MGRKYIARRIYSCKAKNIRVNMGIFDNIRKYSRKNRVICMIANQSKCNFMEKDSDQVKGFFGIRCESSSVWGYRNA